MARAGTLLGAFRLLLCVDGVECSGDAWVHAVGAECDFEYLTGVSSASVVEHGVGGWWCVCDELECECDVGVDGGCCCVYGSECFGGVQ